MKEEIKTDSLLLKWGTLKGWEAYSPEFIKLLDEWFELGSCQSAMLQKDTPRQKEIICELIDLCSGEIQNDWTGEMMSKEDAKKYVMEYGKE